MAAISSIIGAVAAVAAAGIGAATTAKAAHDQRKAAKKAAAAAANTPKYDANKEQQKAAMQEGEANRKRVQGETDTVMTSALGNTGTTEVKKKTLLGG